MRRFFSFLMLCLLSCSALNAQSSKRYVMQPRPEDQLYYILPVNIPAAPAAPCAAKAPKALEYDITYVTSRDSADVRFSFYSLAYEQVDSVALVSGSTRYVMDSLSVLYVEKDKKLWENRLSFSIDYEDLRSLYLLDESFQFWVYGLGNSYVYAFPKAAWRKEKALMSDVLAIIRANL